jgi:predicted nucleic-acid-binding protein
VIAVDTNVFLRLIVNDDTKMSEAALRILTNEGMFVTKTVLLETHWVLRSQMKLADVAATQHIATALGYPAIEVEGGAITHSAVKAALEGLDYEDALHLAGTPEAMPFATFDKRLKNRSARLGFPVVVVHPESRR